MDSLSQTAERGEFQASRCAELALNLKEMGHPGFLSETGCLETANASIGLFSIFDSSGMAIQDVQIAKLFAKYLQEHSDKRKIIS